MAHFGKGLIMVQGKTREDGTWEYSQGVRVKFKLFELYRKYNVPDQAWMLVLGLTAGKYTLQVMNGNKETSQQVVADRSDFAPPIGWRQVYTVTQERREALQAVKHMIQAPDGCLVISSLAVEKAGQLSFLRGSAASETLGSGWAIEVVRDPARFKFKHVLVAHTKPTEKGWTYDRHWREWYKEVDVPWDDL